MGKKKQFINKKESATLKMVQKPLDEAGYDSRVFQKIQNPRTKDEKYVNLADIIEKKLNKGDYTGKITASKKDVVLDQVKGRDDLWINQLAKMKQQEKKLNNQDEDEDEEWEDDEDQQEEEETEQIDKQKFVLHPSIRMKEYDEYGFPLDGYDYKQHLAIGNSDDYGELVGEYVVKAEERQRVTVDMDYKPEEMTEEQREVFEALEYAGNEPIYEELEDDFVFLAQGGEKCLIPAEPVVTQVTQKKQQKKVTFEDDEEMEITYEKHQDDDEEDDDEDEDIEIDSEAEREFEAEMKNFDKKGEEKESKQSLGVQELNKILDDHLFAMKKKNVLNNNNPEQDTKKLLDEDQKERKLYQLKQKDYLSYLKEKYPTTDPSEFHMPQEVAKLELNEDIALLNYLNKATTDSDDKEVIKKLKLKILFFQEEYEDTEVETIITRQFQESQASRINPEQLNIIRYEQTKQQSKPKVDRKQVKERVEERKKVEKNKNQGIQNQIDDHIEIALMQQLVINQDESKEDKQQRKELLKQLKQSKKDKKKAFKESFNEVAKQVKNQKTNNVKQNNAEGVSTIQIN